MLKLVSIKKNYYVADLTVPALKSVDITFRRNEFVAVLGPSGCGKTTLLNIIGGLDRYTEGDLQIDGRSTKEFRSRDWDTYRSRKIGFVFQSYNLIPHITVLANVELALTISGVSAKEKRERALNALERVGLKDQVDKKPGQLSGGQMQRVAIARAIVNNPEIILADEPTGALDSATSVQVLEILKTLAAEHLVVMVTHNAELANRYATRIIKLLDGEVVSDSNSFKEDSEPVESDGINIAQTSKQQVNDVKTEDKHLFTTKKPKRKNSRMSLCTALSLSARNLVTKKVRTILTSVAGSIGIIGIALVLSISNGFSIFMQNLERTTLSSFPITVSPISLDISSGFFSSPLADVSAGTYPDTQTVVPYEPKRSFGNISIHPNYITEAYVDYVKQMETQHPDWLASVSYQRVLKMHLMTDTGTAEMPDFSLVDTVSATATWWQELLNSDFILGEYDLLAGSFPSDSHDLVLIVNSDNELSVSTLQTLGYVPQLVAGSTSEYQPIDFSDFIGENGTGGKTFKLIKNNDYYIPNGENADGVKLYAELDSPQYAAAYADSATELNIVGVIRPKPDADLTLMSSGLGYMSSLTDEVLADCASSDIVQTQKNTYVDVLGNGIEQFEFDFTAVDTYVNQLGSIDISGLPQFYLQLGAIGSDGYNRLISKPVTFAALYKEIEAYDELLDDETAPIDKLLMPLEGLVNLDMIKSFLNADYVERMKEIGADTIPEMISIYPKSFEYKEQIRNYLDDYNKYIDNEIDYIKYNDIASTVSNSVAEMVKTATYVYVAFAAISLFVSSIMIGIITYISVLERTKEIGILRSLGARKIDVSNVFNAETLIIGCVSGVLGVVIAAVLNFPINALITYYAGGMVENLARLNPWHGVFLVILSMFLTVVSGLIPASVAAKKDPVAALRE